MIINHVVTDNACIYVCLACKVAAFQATMLARRGNRRKTFFLLFAVPTLVVFSWKHFCGLHFAQFSQHCEGCFNSVNSERMRENEPVNESGEAELENKGRTFKIKTTLITNTTCSQHYFLLILVSSAPPNFQRRRDIRRTWGVDTALAPRWKTVFLVAQSRAKETTESLLRERSSYRDLLQGDYIDHYWNQTLKIQMGFEWAVRYCNFTFLLKMDDDTFVHTRRLISVLSTFSAEKLYLGMLWEKPLVKRGKDKWTISYEEYNKTLYPDFCPGFGFVLTFDVVNTFVDLFDDVPLFRFDDVYVGMLAERAGVNGTFNPGFRQYPSPPNVPCSLAETVFVWHDITGECLLKLFEDTF